MEPYLYLVSEAPFRNATVQIGASSHILIIERRPKTPFREILYTSCDVIEDAMYMTDSRLAPSQWETWLQSNAVSHWLGANLESTLYIHLSDKPQP